MSSGTGNDGGDGYRGLTRESLEALLACLGSDPEQAAQHYEQIRRKLIRLFEWRGCHNPEDLADETFNRVASQLRKGLQIRSDNPYAYFCGVHPHMTARIIVK